jgi:HPt (histidine-containing phosphotransfer) domain-containing protein
MKIFKTEIDNETTETWDSERAVSRLGGEKSLLKTLATLFIRDTPKLLAEIERGIQQNNYQDAFIPAHSLKGTSGNFCTQSFELMCEKILKFLKEEDWGQAETQLEELILEYTALERSFENFIGS